MKTQASRDARVGKRRSEATLRRRVRAFVRDFERDAYDDVRDALQEADELAKELPRGRMADERKALEQVSAEALTVVLGRERSSKSAPKKPRANERANGAPSGRAFMDALARGQDTRRVLARANALRGNAKDVFVWQVTTVATALAADDTGAWARKQLRTWGASESPFDAEHLERWDAASFRRAIVGALPAFAELVAALSDASFQVREEAMRAVFILVARHGEPEALETKPFARALSAWTDKASILRLANWLHHRATVAKGREGKAFAAMERALRARAPASKTRVSVRK